MDIGLKSQEIKYVILSYELHYVFSGIIIAMLNIVIINMQ